MSLIWGEAMVRAKKFRNKIYLGGMLQGRLASRLAVYWMLYHVVLWHAMFFLSYLEYHRALAAGQRAIPFTELYGAFAWQHRTLVVCAVAVGPMILWDIIRMTHRVAGPLVRLENTLLRMARGETVRELNFRKGDWVVGLERAFNLYLKSLAAGKPAPAVNAASVTTAPSHHNETSQPTLTSKLSSPAAVESPDELDRLLHDLEEITGTVAPIHVGEPQCNESADGSLEGFRRRLL